MMKEVSSRIDLVELSPCFRDIQIRRASLRSDRFDILPERDPRGKLGTWVLRHKVLVHHCRHLKSWNRFVGGDEFVDSGGRCRDPRSSSDCDQPEGVR